MIDYVYLGSAPHDEACAQVGTDDYYEHARRECGVYIEQLTRVVARAGKTIPEGARIARKAERHDYGDYLEVVVRYDDTNEAAVEFAYWLEENGPGKWDDEARAVLFPASEVTAYDALASAFGSTT